MNPVLGSNGAGRLNISGTATLEGTLNVTLANDYVPTVGDTLQLINCGKRQGTFCSVTLNGYTVTPIYLILRFNYVSM